MDEALEVEQSIGRIRGVAKILVIVFRICFLILCIGFALFFGIYCLGVFAGVDPLEGAYINPCMVLSLAFTAVVAGTILWLATGVFSDVSKGVSPFTAASAKRIRIIALVLFLDVVVKTALSPGVDAISLGPIDLGYTPDASADSSSSPFMIDAGKLFMAVIFFCLSLVFEYGVLLQQISDDTV